MCSESGAWANLPSQERAQNLSNLSHIGMLARFDNILGRDTIRTLVRLTAHAPYVFCHPTLVERIASMLNYFLLHLVGPNKKNFKVCIIFNLLNLCLLFLNVICVLMN